VSEQVRKTKRLSQMNKLFELLRRAERSNTLADSTIKAYKQELINTQKNLIKMNKLI